MEAAGKMLIVVGLVTVLFGALMMGLGARSGGMAWLPGDLVFRKGEATFFFPVVTCLVLSVVLTILVRLFGR